MKAIPDLPSELQREVLLRVAYKFHDKMKTSCSKHKGISLNLRATYALNALQKLMNTKTSSYLLMQQHNLQAKKQMKKR
jgi:hypothetical protein